MKSVDIKGLAVNNIASLCNKQTMHKWPYLMQILKHYCIQSLHYWIHIICGRSVLNPSAQDDSALGFNFSLFFCSVKMDHRFWKGGKEQEQINSSYIWSRRMEGNCVLWKIIVKVYFLKKSYLFWIPIKKSLAKNLQSISKVQFMYNLMSLECRQYVMSLRLKLDFAFTFLGV